MSYDGNGTFNRIFNWAQDAANNIDITASRCDTEDTGFAAGLTLCVTRDGQGKMAADFLPASSATYNLGSGARTWAGLNVNAAAIGPPVSGNALTVAGFANQYTAIFTASSTASQSFGLRVQGGTNASDIAFQVNNQSASTTFVQVGGDGGVLLGAPTGGTQGLGTLNATGLFVNGVSVFGVPQNLQSGASYTLVASDANKHIYNQAAVTPTVTIPANASVAFPVGTGVSFVNRTGNNMTIAINTDTMIWSPSGVTGSRTLANNGVATAIKIVSTVWMLTGSGIS